MRFSFLEFRSDIRIELQAPVVHVVLSRLEIISCRNRELIALLIVFLP